MQFKNEFGSLEWWSVGLFVLLYSTYVWRILRIAMQLQQHPYKVLIKLLLRTAYLGLILICLLIPYRKEKEKKKDSGKIVAKDIFVILDASLSMGANDLPPSRFQNAKKQIIKLTQGLKGENFGLIVFPPGQVLCPLTNDVNYFQTLLNSLEKPFNKGTDFFPPLKKALEKHTLKTGGHNKAKVIVLVSDGEDFGEDTRAVVEDIQTAGIKVFALGIGTHSGGKIPKGMSYKKDRNGQFVHTQLNAKSLQELVSLTDGDYYEISTTRQQLPALISQLQQIEGSEQGSHSDVEITNPASYRYFYFLLAAFLLAFLDMTISPQVLKV